MKIIVPMAGNGSRFTKAGFEIPKPLIPISSFKNISMIELVIKNINLSGEYIFIVQEEHYKKYNLDNFLNSVCPNSKIILTNGLTEGAACTVLLAKEYINTDEEILIVNSDQYMDWNREEFLSSIKKSIDGCILTFESDNPNCSYVKLKDNYVSEVAEKKLISNIATVGIYFWKKGSDFIKYAEQMINKNIRTNNEFYICPVYQEAIEDNKKIEVFNIIKYWSLGTPENLKDFEDNYKIK